MIKQKFGKLTVLERKSNDKHRNSRWLCQCTCGGTITVLGMSLRSGKTKSCGCLRQELKEGAGYKGTHVWIRKHKLRPELCERCGKKPVVELSFNNTNKKGFSRDPDDYEWLCLSCHKLKDNNHAYKEYDRKVQELADLFKIDIKTLRLDTKPKAHSKIRKTHSKYVTPEILRIEEAYRKNERLRTL